MADTTLAQLDGALKIFFSGSLVTSVVQDSETLDLFVADNNVQVEQTTGGRYIETAQMFRSPAGVGARRDVDYVPVPSGPIIENARVYLKKTLGSLEMTGDTMRRARGDLGAYVNWLEQSMPMLVERLKNYDDRCILGYGFGALGRIVSITTTNVANDTVTVDRSHGVAGLSNAWLNFLEGDSLVASATINAAALRNASVGGGSAAGVVQTVDQTNSAVVLDAAVPSEWAIDDYLFHGDSASSSSAEGGTVKEFMGLMGMVDDGTIIANFQNIPRKKFTQWNSIVVDGTTGQFDGELSEELVTFVDDEVAIKGGGKGNALIGARSGQRAFWKKLKADRILNDPRTYTGGKKGLMLDLGDRTLEVRATRKQSPELAYLLQTDTFKRHELGTVEWDDTTGSIWRQVTDSRGRKDSFFAYCREYRELSNGAPRKNAKILLAA
jgi:hypothetical protein